MSKSSCEPRLHVLPGLTPTSDARVEALSDSGWVAGASWEDGIPYSAVVWSDPERVVDTGVGGVAVADGVAISASAIDVNESGTVAINRWKSTPRLSISHEEALVWSQQDGATVLPTSRYRPRASVTAINDEGDVLGHVRGRGHGSVPVIWTDGERLRLPVPRHDKAYGTDINNDGLIVGSYWGRYGTAGSWTWDGGPKLMPLRPTDTTAVTAATDVDDSGLIIGGQHVGPGDAIRTILWRNPAASPVRLMRIRTVDLHNSGYLAAVEPGFRGYGATAYIGHRRDGGIKARLPQPSVPDGSLGWSNVYAAAVARGASPFAPGGGVTVGGFAQDFDSMTSQAVLWTCSQTWLNP
ncbi:hypothetical protein ACFQW6_12985 [Nocardioides sp. GCM10028917]|uniref:hypothetical protein n=1 Tax=Nocardioides sp. GCM10028917 TaxID=3273408 RepID=UPI003616348A